jgi:hypothetical protein
LEYSGFQLSKPNSSLPSTTDLTGLNLKLSLASLPQANAQLSLEYFTASSSWTTLDTLDLSTEQSNSLHGGYFTFPLPKDLFSDLNTLQIRFTYQTPNLSLKVPSEPILYLDALWLEADYQSLYSEAEEDLLDELLKDQTIPVLSPDSFTHLDFVNQFLSLSLPGDLNNPITISSKKQLPLKMLPKGVNASSTATRVGNRVTYQEAFLSTDLEYQLTEKGLKENLILKDLNHPARFRYLLNLEDYDFQQISPNRIILFKKGHQGDSLYQLYTLSAPLMTDSQGNASDQLTFRLKKNLLVLVPDSTFLKNAAYPVTIDPTIEISVLNIHSHPVEGQMWDVFFTTLGTQDLIITPADQATVDEMEFVSLTCDGVQQTPQILPGDVLSYPSWSCEGIGQVSHLDLRTGYHHLSFQFGETFADAYNAAVSWDGGAGTTKVGRCLKLEQ